MPTASTTPFSLGTTALTTLLGEWRHGGRAHAELADKLNLLLIDGRIRSGTRLPAEREMAAALGVSRTTIVSAYQKLREAGILQSVQGSGSVLELNRTGVQDATAHPLEIDLGKATPAAWAELPRFAARAVERLPDRMAAGGVDVFGLPELRSLVARRFTERGAPTAPENILITLGAQHAIALVSRTLLGRSDRVVVETPSYPHALDAFLGVGARLVASPHGPGGSDAEHLAATMRDARPSLVYLMPDFHNPTGRSMGDEARERLLTASAQTGTPLLVDETTAELDIDRPFVTTPFAALPSRGASVITVGSISKTVWSGLRVGWIRADRHLIDRFALARPASDMGNTVLDQLVTAELLPEMPRLLHFRTEQLGAGRDRAMALLGDLLPEWEVPPVHGGLALWASLGAPLSSALVLSARAVGVTITSGSRFGIDGAFERNIRIPIALPLPTLTDGIERLAEAWATVGSIRRSATAETALVV